MRVQFFDGPAARNEDVLNVQIPSSVQPSKERLFVRRSERGPNAEKDNVELIVAWIESFEMAA